MVGTSQDNLQKHRLTFRRLDTDGGGSLSKEEFLDAIKRETEVDWARQRDRAGIAGASDAAAYDDTIQSLSSKIPEDFDTFIWPNVDLNQSDDINFTEFMQACLADDETTIYSERHWRGVFQVLDVHNRGKLDVAVSSY